ncbi:hypothetical protein BWQ96_00568 [Gracilariopsis chorda]|uniref:Uncharacterized protein n=1 Tax=Gracilariopsis chorda TaxID=448386 RepID=A0A2V3JAH0_9FLOR|nr:hypothetical protein BWQ96_00568 [Gracilariopsis chorda]|eukprot:PXF49690.1 hypothetical protein BWQ96_00568 [Gracilariopsis chorda]
MNTRFDSVLDENIKRMNTFFDERLHEVKGKIEDAMYKKSVEIRRLSKDSDTRLRCIERKLGTEQPLANVKIPPSEAPRAHSSHCQQRDSGGQSTFKTGISHWIPVGGNKNTQKASAPLRTSDNVQQVNRDHENMPPYSSNLSPDIN